MSFLSSLLGRVVSSPKIYETDQIQPVHLLDDVQVLAGYDLFWTFPFSEILDANLLGRTLSEVIETGDWRRLGGRIRRNVSSQNQLKGLDSHGKRRQAAGRLELHVPTSFTPGRPALYFSQDHADQRMKDHPIASQIPTAGERAQLFPESRVLAPLAYGPGAPRSLEDRLAGDFPQIALHVVTFQDGTVVSLSWNHIMSDLGGFAALIKAWVGHLAGKPIPEFKSKDDAMRSLSENPPQEESLLIQDWVLSGWRKALWIAQFLCDQWWTSSAPAMHQACIPRDLMNRLLKNCREAAVVHAEELGCDAFISEGDIITALGVRGAALTLGQLSRRSVAALSAIDVRSRFPDIYSEDVAYIQNMSVGVFTVKPAREVLDMSIGALALSLRESVKTQASQVQLRLVSCLAAKSVQSTGNLPLVGDSTSYLSVTSNWSKARLLEIMDLGPAVARPGRRTNAKAIQTSALPFAFHSKAVHLGRMTTPVLMIRGRDHNGDMWVEGECSSVTWREMMNYVNSQ